MVVDDAVLMVLHLDNEIAAPFSPRHHEDIRLDCRDIDRHHLVDGQGPICATSRILVSV